MSRLSRTCNSQAGPSIALLVVVFLAMVTGVQGQQAQPLPATGANPSSTAQVSDVPALTIRRDVKLVLVDVLITDGRGRTLNGLRAKDVQLLDESIPQEIAHFGQDEIPIAIAIVIDASESMTEVIEPVRKGLIQALPSLKDGDRVALFSFQEIPRLEVPLGRDAELLSRRIRRLVAMGWTNVNDAVYHASRYLRENAPESRRVILLVSDLEHTWAYRRPAEEVESELLESDVTLFCIATKFLGSRIRDGHGKDRVVSVPLLAQASGGWLAETWGETGIQRAVEVAFHDLKSRYTLGFYPNPPPEAGVRRRIAVHLVNAGIERVLPGAFARYRRQYAVPRTDTVQSTPSESRAKQKKK